MKKKIIVIAAMTMLIISMAMPALASAQRNPATPVHGYGLCGGTYAIMWDQDGNFLDSEAFEANLDKLIEDGYILAQDRDFFLERYEWCATYGGRSVAVRGGRRGRGRGMGCGW